jgi:alpha-L-rhamnosidase
MFEHRTDYGPVLGIATPQPRLSWVVEHAESGWRQTAYEVEITRGGTRDIHRVASDEQVLVPWPGRPLRARERAEVRVRVASGAEWSDWSAASAVEAGLFDRSDWSARFITPNGIGEPGAAAPVLNGTIVVPGPVRQARLHATAHGVYVPWINGRRISDSVLAPGWTAYDHRLRYHVYDVTPLIRTGPNHLEVLLGNGWYRGRLGFANERALYGTRLALLAQLEVTTTDGVVHVLATDETWTARESEIVADDLYDGQVTDLRRRGTSARTAGVAEVEWDLDRLVGPEGPPVRPTGVLPATRVWTAPSGSTLVDFGQNAVGWTRLTVRGLDAGSKVTLRHAEVLEDGELGTRPLRSAKATDTWFLDGPGERVLEPTLTLHGFRYAEVSGVPDLGAEDIEHVVVGSDLPRAGWFSSSNELLNRFHENVAWSMRGNFVDIPTDCPQRDERLGWTGDIQVFAPTATFLFDSTGFLSSWLADVAAEQLEDGSVPHVVPDVIRAPIGFAPAAAWGDAATVVPWTLYERSGDRGILERQFPSMRAWVEKVVGTAGPSRLWIGGFQYGDWLDPAAPPDQPGRAKADRDVVATAHFARSADILARTAALLDRNEDAERYAQLASQIRAAFAREYITPAGRVVSDAQTVYALAIEWNLFPHEAQRHEAGLRLADLVRASGFRISTGFVGTPIICDALTSTGHAELAYRMLLQTACPSWLYPVTMGATTIWERWDSIRPDGSINPGEMTSFNHYALGAVADWMHRTVAGLAPAAPGYREIRVEPHLTSALSSASARHETPYGEAAVAWQRHDGVVDLRVVVPVGATAHVRVPGTELEESVGHGQHTWRIADMPTRDERAPTTIRDLVDDRSAWNALVTAVAEVDIDDVAAAHMLAAHLDAPACRLPLLFTIEEYWPGALELRARLEQVVEEVLERPRAEPTDVPRRTAQTSRPRHPSLARTEHIPDRKGTRRRESHT